MTQRMRGIRRFEDVVRGDDSASEPSLDAPGEARAETVLLASRPLLFRLADAAHGPVRDREPIELETQCFALAFANVDGILGDGGRVAGANGGGTRDQEEP